MSTLNDFQARLSLRFANADLLQQALTHRSYVNEHGPEAAGDNERLEFLGDAVLDFVVGDMLYQRFPELPEGDLTRLRAALVRTDTLAGLAEKLGIGEQLQMGKGEESTGGRERPTNLCAAFEALVGALYLDNGLEVARLFVVAHMDELLTLVLNESLDRDARSAFQEWSQARLDITPVYETVSASGPDHLKEFVVEVKLGSVLAGRGSGRSKQAAAQAAARDAMRRLTAGELTEEAILAG